MTYAITYFLVALFATYAPDPEDRDPVGSTEASICVMVPTETLVTIAGHTFIEIVYVCDGVAD